MKKRFLIIVSVVLCMFFILSSISCSCGKNTENEYDSEAGIDRTKVVENIVENGNSEFKIVYSNHATECEKFSALQLQKYILQITGVNIQILQERTLQNSNKFISIGQTQLLKNEKIETKDNELNGDGFIIKTVKNNLYISGANDRGTLYGVYDFLEKICNVHFLDINYEYVPTMESVPLYKMDIKEIPTFRYRGCLTDATTHTSETPGGTSHGRNGETVAEFFTKIRNNDEFLREESQIVADTKLGGTIKINKDINQTHNNLTYVPVSEYYFTNQQKADNAHMFYIVDGKPVDICYSDGIDENGEIESSNEMTTATAYLNGLKKYIKQNPNAEFYTVGQEDLRTCCSCETCYERTRKYGTTTASVMLFYNAMAREIQRWADTQKDLNGKKIYLVAFSYLFSAQAPVKAIKNSKGEVEKYEPVHEKLKTPENLILRIASFDANMYYSFTDKNNNDGTYGPEYLKKWKSVIGESGRSWYWGYLTTHGELFNYVPSLQGVKDALTDLSEFGTEFALLQHNSSEYTDYKAIMENYIISKLLWNPNRNVNVLRKEFLKYYYDIVADDIEEFTINYEEKIGNIIQNVNKRYFSGTSDATYLPLTFIDNQIAILDNAIIKIENSDYSEEVKTQLKDKVVMAKLYPLYRKLVNRDTFYAGNNDMQNQVTKEFFDLCEHFGVNYYGEHKALSDLKGLYPYK